MNPFRLLVFSLVGAALLGCASTWPQPRPSACPRHHIPLLGRTMFAPPPTTNVCPSDDYIDVMARLRSRAPYSIPFGFTESPDKAFRVRCRVYFCPECQQSVERAFAEHRR